MKALALMLGTLLTLGVATVATPRASSVPSISASAFMAYLLRRWDQQCRCHGES